MPMERKIAVAAGLAGVASLVWFLALPRTPPSTSKLADMRPGAATGFPVRDEKSSVDTRVADLRRQITRLSSKLARETAERRRLAARLDELAMQLSAAAPAGQAPAPDAEA